MPSSQHRQSGLIAHLYRIIPRIGLRSKKHSSTPYTPRSRSSYEFDDADGHTALTSTEVIGVSYPRGSKRKHKLRLPLRFHKFTQPIMRHLNISWSRASARNSREDDVRNITSPGSGASVLQSPFVIPPPELPAVEKASDLDAQLLRDRAIRADQDNALELALKQDRERAVAALEAKRMADEIENQARKRLALEISRREQEEAYKELQTTWRRWARRVLVPGSYENKGVKIAVRLPSGKRCTWGLPSSASLGLLHTLVETLLIPPEYAVGDDPEEAPEGYTHEFGFRLATTNTRRVMPNDDETRVGDLEVLRKGVLLIVEDLVTKPDVKCRLPESDSGEDDL
jgi:hypothetical protein